MKKLLKSILGGILCSLVILSCETEIPLDQLDIPSKMVVNTAFQPDSNWKLHLSYSLPVGDTSEIKGLSKASINIRSGNGATFSLLETSEGIYESDVFPQERTTYYLTIAHEGFATIKANDRVPLQIQATLVDTFMSMFLELPVLTTTLEIADSPEEENYYVIEAILHYKDSLDKKYSSSILLYPIDELAENRNINGEDITYRRVFLKDNSFSGMNHPTRFHIVKPLFAQDNGNTPLRLNIHLRSVSQSLYEYLFSFEKLVLREQDLSLGQPVQVSSNIEGGLGIFGAYTEQIFSIEY